MTTQTLKKILIWLKPHLQTASLAVAAMVLVLTCSYAAEKLQGHFLMRLPAKQTSSVAMRRQITRKLQRKRAVSSRASQRSSAARVTWQPRSNAGVIVAAAASAGYLHGAAGDFPAFGWTVHPVSSVPDWGRMRSPSVWDLPYGKMPEELYVPVPAYDLGVLTIPMRTLIDPVREADIPLITAKLYYSTRHLGKYDIDAGEHTGFHPGIDLKLPVGTPVGAIAGGRVHAVAENESLGLYVIVEHRHPKDGTFFSIYGHLGETAVSEGEDLSPGDVVGRIGLTGNTSGGHLHLQVDADDGKRPHQQYVPAGTDDGVHTLSPIEFIARYAQ